MTLKELQEKNARIRAKREAARAIAQVAEEIEKNPAPAAVVAVEETPHIITVPAEGVPEVTIKGDFSAVEEEYPKKAKKGKKPAKREYMVVEEEKELLEEENSKDGE